jgi:hypothetical protein
MRYNELIIESMSFSAGHQEKRPDGIYWVGDTDSGDRYGSDFYKNSDKYMYGDEEAPENPDYKPELDLNLANANMREVFATLGYPTDLEEQKPFPIDEFIGRTTQWLQKNIGKRSAEEPTTVDKSGGGATMISGGKPEGYFNEVIMRMNKIARIGKDKGATHVWAA